MQSSCCRFHRCTVEGAPPPTASSVPSLSCSLHSYALGLWLPSAVAAEAPRGTACMAAQQEPGLPGEAEVATSWLDAASLEVMLHAAAAICVYQETQLNDDKVWPYSSIVDILYQPQQQPQ